VTTNSKTVCIKNPLGETAHIKENSEYKMLSSPNYNYAFHYSDGNFTRWGKTLEDDPKFSPFGPEILDIEIGTICHGINNKPCSHCYKSNTGCGDNMTLDQFKVIFNKIPKTLTQIAFGIGDIDSNPDMFDMFRYCRENDYNYVVPNVTINGWNLTDEYARKLSELCGAVAISRYSDPDVCYNAVKKLSDLGMKQVNIHMLLSKETLLTCMELIDHYKTDPRLQGLNAIVFLLLKPKGKRNRNTKVSLEEYHELNNKCIENKIRYGFDSCSAPLFLSDVKDSPDFEHYSKLAECCESDRFSAYINYKGEYWHCSFTENHHDWKGIDVLNCNDFLKDVWFNDELIKFRRNIFTNCHRSDICDDCYECPTFDIYPVEFNYKPMSKT
jgi:hypothetical protein